MRDTGFTVLPVASLLSVKRASLSSQLPRNRLGSKLLSNTGQFSTSLLCRLHFSVLHRDPMGKDWSCGESLFKCFKGGMALIGEMPGGTLAGKMHERDCDFRISVNEMTVEIGKAKEGLNVLDFSWNWPILDNLDFVWGHGEAFGSQHISEVFAGSDVELAFVCMGKKSISTESVKYFSDVSLVFGNVVRVDEYVIQIV